MPSWSETLHRLLDLVDLPAADHVPDERGVDEHLHGGKAATILADHQTQRDHRLQVEAEIHQDVAMRRLREEVEDPFQGLVGVVGVQGR